MRYAIVEESLVENVVEAESEDILKIFFGDKKIILATDETDEPYIGGFFNEKTKKFEKPQPYPSWIRNPDSGTWEAPVSYPEEGGFFAWDESLVNWVKIEEPEIQAPAETVEEPNA